MILPARRSKIHVREPAASSPWGSSARLAALVAMLLLLDGPAAHAQETGLRVRWLGVAGFSIEAGDDVLLHDPYLSRPGFWRTLFRRYQPDAAVLGPLFEPGSPAPELSRASLVLVGHSHFDHLGDVPWIAERTGGQVVGSPTTANIARGYGSAPHTVSAVAPGDRIVRGSFEVRVVESRHARLFFGNPPLPGEVLEPPQAPIHALSVKLGGALAYLVTHLPSGLRVFLLSSADVHPPALDALAAEGVRVDLLLPASQGRDPDYAARLVKALRPRRVVPHHYDDFFRPLDDPDAAAPGDPEDLAAFEAELLAAAEEEGHPLEVRRLDLFEALEVFPAP